MTTNTFYNKAITQINQAITAIRAGHTDVVELSWTFSNLETPPSNQFFCWVFARDSDLAKKIERFEKEIEAEITHEDIEELKGESK